MTANRKFISDVTGYRDDISSESFEEGNLQSLASWKFDVCDAVVLGLSGPEFRAFYCLLQHANAETKLIMPSQERLATMLNCNLSTVERLISSLVRKKIITISRKNRQKTNRYAVNIKRVQALANLRIRRLRAYREARLARLAEGSVPDPAGLTGQDPAPPKASEPAKVRGEHLNTTPEHNTSTLAMKGGKAERNNIGTKPVVQTHVSPDLDKLEKDDG